jgi:hypothetical protein
MFYVEEAKCFKKSAQLEVQKPRPWHMATFAVLLRRRMSLKWRRGCQATRYPGTYYPPMMYSITLWIVDNGPMFSPSKSLLSSREEQLPALRSTHY